VLNTRKLLLGVSVFTVLAASGGCHVARKPVVLIEPTYFQPIAANADARDRTQTFQIAAVQNE
jgi:hypothetical protein